MGSSLDALNNAPSSLGSRRQAASNLPTFELPPPSNIQFVNNGSQKFPPLSSLHPIHHQPSSSSVSVGNLLTPPSGSASDSHNAGSSMPNGTAANNNHNNNIGPVLPYTPTFYGTPGGSFHTGFTPQPWQQSSNPMFPPRPMFSPSLGSLLRNNTNSPTAADAQNHPQQSQYDMQGLPPFQQAMTISPPPSVTPTSQAHPHPHPHPHPHHQQQALANGIMQSHMRGPSQSSPTTPGDGLVKPFPPAQDGAPNTSSTPQQPVYAYTGPSPVQQSPQTSSAPASRVSPPLGQNQMQSHHIQQQHFHHPPYPSYTIPGMPGPAMSNMHRPGGNLQMIGNMQNLPAVFNSGSYVQNAMYGNQRAPSPHQGPTERPFKCDQCPQSFNRNHDLKRHKRIHLAVKPFPCGHCDKSFSRKDALKRHILVKGCGKRGSLARDEGTKSESGSDDPGSDEPTTNGHA